MDTQGAPGDDSDMIDGDDLSRLEVLYRDRAQASVRLAQMLLGNHGRAEELTQDAFVRLAPRLQDLDNPAGYLAHHLGEFVPRRGPPPPGRAPSPHPRHRSTPPCPGCPPRRLRSGRSVQALPHRQRAALTLRFYGDASTDEIDAEGFATRSGPISTLDLVTSVPDLSATPGPVDTCFNNGFSLEPPFDPSAGETIVSIVAQLIPSCIDWFDIVLTTEASGASVAVHLFLVEP